MSQQEQWQVAGNAAEIYEEELVPAIFAPWAPLVVDLAYPQEGERVLDVACGTGIVARTLASCVGPGGAVAGVDLNPGMLKVARRVCSTESHSIVQIEWHEASADKLPFSDALFDVVCCQLGLQFFPDRAAALREMHRVLVPGGRLTVMVWRGIHESPGFASLAEAFERHVGRAAAEIMRAPFGLSDSEDLTALVRAAGFHDIVIQRRVGTVRFTSAEKLVSSYIAGSPLAGPLSQANDAARQAVVADVQNALGKYVTDTGLAFPTAAHLLSAKA
jgi:ubiquinone/menaquinone biosynthesis C-methylase UbiE